ncbi:MAG TPA: DegV family protein [Dehalococcoidia bacterium]|nr:DegV family protein [Dehalococcoidia bacterium]
MRIAIVTDSSACLPPELVQRYGLTVVPHRLHLDGQTFEDGALSPAEFYSLLARTRGRATTSSPSPGAFLAAFRRACEGKEGVLCLTLSSRYSATFSAAENAARQLREERPQVAVEVVDSRCLAMAYGFVVLAAARAAENGASLAEAVRAAQAAAGRASLIGVVDTLRYLAMSGRVPWIAHWATSVLQIKPILTADGDEVRLAERVRTRRRALERLVAIFRQRLRPGLPLQVAVMHAAAAEDAQDLAQRLDEFRPEELLLTEFTPVMGVHVGPGFVGIAYYQRDGEGTGGAEDVARVLEALSPLPPPSEPPALVVLVGLPGSGKSTFARRLQERAPLAVLESDRFRKLLFGRPTYSPEESRRLFRALHAAIDSLLGRRISCLLDATNLREEHRRPLYEMAERHGARLVLVQMEAPAEVVRSRLERRRRAATPGDWSDAGPEVYERMREAMEPISRPHLRVDSTADTGQAVEEVLRAMGRW